MTAIIHPDASADRIGEQARFKAARRVRGLSDRGIAWLFVAPTIALLLAINIFPLIWMIRLSFTSLNLSMSYLPLRFVGLDNFNDILTDEDVWARSQTTASFVISSVALQVVIGFGLALLINRQFRSHSFWTTIILVADDAVAGRGRQLLDIAVSAADRTVQLCRRPLHRHSAELLQHDRRSCAGALDHRAGRQLDVVALRDADLPRRAAFDSRLHLRSRRGRPRVVAAAVLVDHAADGHAVSDAGGAVPRDRELQDVRHGQSADLGRAGLDHGARLDHAQAGGVREMAHRLFARRSPSSCSSRSSAPPTSTSKSSTG